MSNNWHGSARGREKFAPPPMRVVHVVLDRRASSGELRHVVDLVAAQLRSGQVYPLVIGPTQNSSARQAPSLSIPAAFRALVRLLHGRDSPQVIHAHGSTAVLLLTFVQLLLKKPSCRVLLVITFHGWVEDTWLRKMRCKLEIRFSKRAHVIIVCNPTQINRLDYLPDRPIHCIPNGVRIVDFNRNRTIEQTRLRNAWDLPRCARVVINVGRLAREKRQDLFLSAAVHILREVEDVYFLIVGDGPERRTLERLAARRDLVGRVRFTGFVDDIPATMCGADILLHTADMDASPRVIVEAMSAGTAVVATKVGGIPSLIRDGHNGFLVPRGNYLAAASRTVELLLNAPLHQKITTQARDCAAEKFSIEKMQDRVLLAYRNGATLAVIGKKARIL